MAVIINRLSQCDSCGPLKIGLNDKIPADGNFFSSPAPSFSLPLFSLAPHANVFFPSLLPKHLPPQSLLLGMAGDRLQFCFPVKARWELTLLGPSVSLALGKVPDTGDFCHLPADLSPYTSGFLLPARLLPLGLLCSDLL